METLPALASTGERARPNALGAWARGLGTVEVHAADVATSAWWISRTEEGGRTGSANSSKTRSLTGDSPPAVPNETNARTTISDGRLREATPNPPSQHSPGTCAVPTGGGLLACYADVGQGIRVPAVCCAAQPIPRGRRIARNPGAIHSAFVALHQRADVVAPGCPELSVGAQIRHGIGTAQRRCLSQFRAPSGLIPLLAALPPFDTVLLAAALPQTHQRAAARCNPDNEAPCAAYGSQEDHWLLMEAYSEQCHPRRRGRTPARSSPTDPRFLVTMTCRT